MDRDAHLGNIISNFLLGQLLAVHSPARGGGEGGEGGSTALPGCVLPFLHISLDSHTFTCYSPGRWQKKRCYVLEGKRKRVGDTAGRLLASVESQGDKEKKKNERRIHGFVEPEREEAAGRSSPAAGGSEDSKYHKSCSSAAADALWISRTPGNPNGGSLCTRRPTAGISISVWFAQIRARGGCMEQRVADLSSPWPPEKPIIVR